MGSKQQLEGIYPREASILVSFQWEGKRYRERLALSPTPANLRFAARVRDEIVSAIKIDKFTLDDFARHFPDSPAVKAAKRTGATFSNVADTWLKLAEQELAATTVKEYRNVLAKNFKPVFGDKMIAQITYEDLALYLAGMNIKSAKTFNNLMTPVRQIFAYALKTDKIRHDITRDIPSRKNQKPGPDPLELQEIAAILVHIGEKYGEQWLNYFEFSFFSGLRPSEMIALKWGNIDFNRKKARIDAARVRAVDKETKTHRARDIDLQTKALTALQRQKKHTFMKEGQFVFCNPYTGERLHDTGPPVQLVWRPALKALGIRDRDARQTRHSFATMCLHAGMNPAYVARQMGHSNPRMFFEVYSKWMDGDASDREKSKLDALFSTNKQRQAL